MSKAEAVEAHPGFPWLELDDPRGIEGFMRRRSWLADDERFVGCQKAGEGNMNLTLRVTTDRRTLILKQARPWVEKYPRIPAPWDRGRYEQRFYERVSVIPAVAARMPRLIDADPEATSLLLEDLPGARDFNFVYQQPDIRDEEVADLAAFLAVLHTATLGEPADGFANRDMRRLNHQHLFLVPLDEGNGIDLDSIEAGLAAAASRLWEDAAYRRLAEETGKRYLADGRCLVHGDFFPGSWLRTGAGVRVIDPEFCFCGDPEVDLGCVLAHFALAAIPRQLASRFLETYTCTGGQAGLSPEWVARYAAIEVMRRLIGVAQLPLRSGKRLRAELLARSRRAMLQENWERLWD